MAVISTARTTWTGDLQSGSGHTELATSRAAEFDVHWKARSEGSDSTTTPEELLAAAHASCYAMALSKALADAGATPVVLDVQAQVSFVVGEGVTTSALTVSGDVDDISVADFSRVAEEAKAGCPISQALGGVTITLESASLEQ
ncbi:MAG: OsmC family peroxiredoxin [Demequina sp.]